MVLNCVTPPHPPRTEKPAQVTVAGVGAHPLDPRLLPTGITYREKIVIADRINQVLRL